MISDKLYYGTELSLKNERIASDEALMLHWKRTCWILHMWSQSGSSAMMLLPMTGYG